MPNAYPQEARMPCQTPTAVSGALLPEPPLPGLRPNAYGVTSPSTSMSGAPVFMSGPVW